MKAKKVVKLQCTECEEVIEEEEDVKKVTAYKVDDYAEDISEDVDDLVEEIEAFKCPVCEALSESRDELFTEVEKFECGECGELYDDKEEAKSCCK